MRIISFIDQPDVIKKILEHLVSGKSPRPLQTGTKKKVITFDPSYSQPI